MPLFSGLKSASIVIGLGGGYWLVSRVVERRSVADSTPEDLRSNRQVIWISI